MRPEQLKLGMMIKCPGLPGTYIVKDIHVSGKRTLITMSSGEYIVKDRGVDLDGYSIWDSRGNQLQSEYDTNNENINPDTVQRRSRIRNHRHPRL